MAKARASYGTTYVAPDDRPIEDVWKEYKKTYSEDLRNRLMERYLQLVKYNAERIHTKLPDEVDDCLRNSVVCAHLSGNVENPVDE